MNPTEILTRQLESLITTSDVLEITLLKNPKLIAIVEDTLAKVKKIVAESVTVTEDGRIMEPVDISQSPIRFLAKKIEDDRRRREQHAAQNGKVFEGDKDA
jgi:hypothetical protein